MSLRDINIQLMCEMRELDDVMHGVGTSPSHPRRKETCIYGNGPLNFKNNKLTPAKFARKLLFVSSVEPQA